MDTTSHCINICMGSSCFSRGNRENAEVIQAWLAERGLRETVTLRGELCQRECSIGPTIEIDGERHVGVRPITIGDILNAHFARPR